MAVTLTNPNTRPVVTGEGTTANMGVAIAIDYTAYYDRIATALETIATNSTAIKNSLATITTNSTATKDSIATIENSLNDGSTSVVSLLSGLVDQQTTMATKVSSLEDRAKNDGIKILGPWEWLGMSSIVRLYDEKGVDYNALKTRVEQIPKSS